MGTGKKCEDLCPTSHNMMVPIVTKTIYSVMDVSDDGQLSLLTDEGEPKDDLNLPTGTEDLDKIEGDQGHVRGWQGCPRDDDVCRRHGADLRLPGGEVGACFDEATNLRARCFPRFCFPCVCAFSASCAARVRPFATHGL